VLIGALGKIQHWNIGGVLLTIGMSVEAFIFFFLGVLPPHKDYYWERFYPNIDENPIIEAYRKGQKFKAPTSVIGMDGKSVSANASLDKMLEDAEISPANLKRLNETFTKFGTTVEQMKDITDVTAATGTYSESAREAAV